MRPEFENAEVLRGGDALAELQQQWEDKVVASRVADFELPMLPPLPPVAALRMMRQYAPLLWPQGQSRPAQLYHQNAHRAMPHHETEDTLPAWPGDGPYIPQVDGSPEHSPDSQCIPRPSTSQLPPASSSEINSDLDDSDTDEEDNAEQGSANLDTIFCTYEKVSRHKAKWECVLNNGVIHVDGKDYLFSKCTGFEGNYE
ncbi:transcription factor IIA alpha/beta subunit [Mycena leptocephala]|nr:transcription factor IIA alpha/beta subunit [Mycena leptocephala]